MPQPPVGVRHPVVTPNHTEAVTVRVMARSMPGPQFVVLAGDGDAALRRQFAPVTDKLLPLGEMAPPVPNTSRNSRNRIDRPTSGRADGR
jgi:hypothetical protein